MNKKTTNPCIICGKERIVSTSKKEKVGNSVIVSTVSICPDKECQAKVDVILAKEKAHRDEIQTAFRKREKMRAKKASLSRQRKSITLGPKKQVQIH